MPEPSNNQARSSSSAKRPLKAIFYREWENSYIPQILEEVYIKQVYKQFLVGQRDLVIADWGANAGITAQYFSNYAKIVYAVEPSKEHIEVIEELIKFNKIKNIKICPYAISNENGTTKFYHPENVTMFSMENVMQAKEYEEVETVDVETFFKREGIDHIDLLKFDIEGSEGLVLASESFQKMAPKIRVICGEWHTWSSMSQDLFANTFRDLGYHFNWRRDTNASVFEAVKI